MAGQRPFNTPNPLNYNYPKIAHLRGNQYNSYPKFKETEREMPKEKSEKEKLSENLAKELEKQIKELQLLTKEAKDLAKKV